MTKKYPTQHELQEFFKYSEEGALIRIKRVRKGCEIGDVVLGSISHNYRALKFNGGLYLMHRLIWILNYGDLQENEIVDHIDRNKINNKIENLRKCSHSQNTMNRGGIRANTGIKGISLYETTSRIGKKYQYYMCSLVANGKKYCKNFPYTNDGLEQAKIEILNMRSNLHGEFGCDGVE